MKKAVAGKSLADFAAAYDPKYVVNNPTTVYARELRKVQRYIITAAQNATPVHPGFWAILVHMGNVLDAEKFVGPVRYKNPTSSWTGSQANAEYWAEEVRPFLWNARHDLNANLTLLGDIKIQPTASDPLTGAEAITGASSGIVYHPKVQTRSVATPQSSMAKLMLTTGACTVENYTDSRVGRIGHFHHSLSALLVEIDGKRFFVRRLHYDTRTNSVTDAGTGKRYFADRSEKMPRALAVPLADMHVDFTDPAVDRATFGKGGIIEVTDPLHVIYHDLNDDYACNPHHFGNAFNRIAKRMTGRDSWRGEVDRAIAFVRERSSERCKSVIVASNHDDFLRRAILNTDWREDPVNAEFYLETALMMVRGTKMTDAGTEYPDPFRYWFRKAKVPNSVALENDESFQLGGVELSMHGDRGPNGARGSLKNLRRIGVKSIIGHSHSPGEDEGATQLGTSTRLRLEYNGGPSSWLNAHCVLNADGKRQLIVIVDGRWRL